MTAQEFVELVASQAVALPRVEEAGSLRSGDRLAMLAEEARKILQQQDERNGYWLHRLDNKW